MATGSKASKKRAVRAPTPERVGGASDELVARHRRALPTLRTAVLSAAERLRRDRALQLGNIVLHSGSGAGGYMLKCSEAVSTCSRWKPALIPRQLASKSSATRRG
jgi:hypothetical protein